MATLLRLFLFLATVTVLLPAQQYALVELKATGSERYEEADILAYTGLTVDKTNKVPLENVKEAAQKLAGSGAFAEVNYNHTTAPGGMKVEFILIDLDDDQFAAADFENMVWFTGKQLNDELHKRIPLFYGQVATGGNMASEVATVLEAMLETRGVKAHVSSGLVAQINAKDNKLEFTVDELDIKIGRVSVPDASPRFANDIAAVAKKMVGLTYQKAVARSFIKHDLRDVFQQQGYLRASFAEPETSVISNSPARTEVEVVIPVQEGRSYKFKDATWSGNTVLKTEDLQKYLHISPGTVLNGIEFNRDLNGVRIAYAQMGYMKMSLKPDVLFDDVAGTVSYVLRISEGELFKMGKLEIEGATAKSADQLRLAWKMREGEPFDSTYVSKFTASLKSGSFFFYVEQSESEKPNTTDVTLVFCNTKEACHPSKNVLNDPDSQ